MNIYLDESYNLQKDRGKMFISINGFAVLDDRALRKRWRIVRKPYLQFKRRLHATDPSFEGLRGRSIKLFEKHEMSVLSVFQLIQEIPHHYFDKDGIKFDSVYAVLLKKLFIKLQLDEYKRIVVVIDARKHKGGGLMEKIFIKEMKDFLKKQFVSTVSIFKMVPSYTDILLELADFVSNSFFKEYHNGTKQAFENNGFRVVQIKNPL